MEVVIQWLDEVDDWVFAAAFLWRGLRRLCLGFGFLAAIALLVAASRPEAAALWPAFAAIAVLSIAVWSATLLGHLLRIADRKIFRLQA